MRRFRLIPDSTSIAFMRHRLLFLGGSILAILLSVIAVLTVGLNFGIDFRGGTLLEVRMPGPADLATMRRSLNDLGLGQVQLQNFGDEREVLIRIERQEGEAEQQQKAIEIVKQRLVEDFGDRIEFRRAEFVGPKVSEELLRNGIMAVLLAVALVLVYIWFRFEWQFGAGAVFALVHDVATTIGVFAVVGLEFNLSTVAAILTIVGYSLNDTVVVYDRIRENLRRFKTLKLEEVIDRSINETLSRTLMTSLTTLLALFALFFFGGAVIRDFTFAMIWGVVVGTYSSIYIAAPVLIYFNLRAVLAKEGSASAAG